VSATSSGELSREFAGVVADVRTGLPLAPALQALARRIQLPALTRCVDQVNGALERGSPLAEVLRAQAQDAREESKRGLLEAAGKKEVAMLVPVVFSDPPIDGRFRHLSRHLRTSVRILTRPAAHPHVHRKEDQWRP
jgi:tight adherence protein C